jgi:hypothetical protein
MRQYTTKYLVVNPRYATSRVEANTVYMQHMMCRIYDFMRHVEVFRIESVVLQVSTIIYEIQLCCFLATYFNF